MNPLTFLALFIVSLLVANCGPAPVQRGSPIAADTSCAANSARISVGDGFLQILCGCNGAGEEPGATFSTPGGLTCHLQQRDSIVHFYYLGTVLRHQVVSVGPNAFPPSPVSNPSDSAPFRVFAVTLSTPGATYNFRDMFSSMTGQIVVP